MVILKFYKAPGLKTGQLKNKLYKVSQIEASVTDLETELCYYVETLELFQEDEVRILKWILSPLFEGELRCDSVFNDIQEHVTVIEIGPR